MTKYRVVLIAEDGEYVLRDGFTSAEEAIYYLRRAEPLYGEGQKLVYEEYKA